MPKTKSKPDLTLTQIIERNRAAKAAKIVPNLKALLDDYEGIAPAPEAAPDKPAPVYGRLADGTMVRLRLHPNLEVVRGWEDEPRFETLCASVQEIGIITPLLVHLTGEMDPETGAEWADVVDGKHRFKAALRAVEESMSGTHPVPVEVTEQSADEVIIVTLTNRRHLRKGAMAYLLYPLIKPQIEASKARRAANLKTGKSRKTPEATIGDAASEFLAAKTEDEDIEATLLTLAEKHGLGRDSLTRARKLHQYFADFPDERDSMEADLLSGRSGLGGLIAGIAGREETEGKSRAATAEPATLCSRFLKSFRHNFGGDRWTALPLAQRATIQETLVGSVMADWPAEIVVGLRDALKQWKPSTPDKKGGPAK